MKKSPIVSNLQEIMQLPLKDVKFVLKYLKKYGYITDNSTLEEISKSIIEFQGFFGLKQDGIVGPKTLNAMSERRCGVSDVLRELEARGKWNKTDLTYTIIKHLDEFSRNEFKDIMDAAFGAWSKYAKIKFTYTDLASANVVVSTSKGQAIGFDGPSGVLAWANLPSGNDSQLKLMFDEDETWLQRVPNAGRGIYCLNVATHEVGHICGLEHSQVKSALMAPYYSPEVVSPQQNDDIPRIQNLYGKNSDTPSPSPPSPSPTTEIKLTVKSIEKVEIPGYRIIKI